VKLKLYMCGGERPVSQYPLGLGYLKSNIAGHDVEIVDSPDKLTDCDIIGLSSPAWGVREAYEILNGTDIPVAIGGQASMWDRLPELGFNWVVRGPGEAVMQTILAGKQPEGLVSDCNFKIPINSLKIPERGVCHAKVPIITSRGCPYKCRFCSSQVFWKGVEFHSAEYFINEMDYITKHYKGNILCVLDDLIVANKTRFKQIHELWMKRGFHKRWKVNGFVRSNLFDKELGLMMKQMGFDGVRFGAESGSDAVLKRINKGTTVADHQRAIDVGAEIGLPVSASFMINLPGETEQERLATVKFIQRNNGKLDVRGYYSFRAFPGTEYYNGEDLLHDDMRVR